MKSPAGRARKAIRGFLRPNIFFIYVLPFLASGLLSDVLKQFLDYARTDGSCLSTVTSEFIDAFFLVAVTIIFALLSFSYIERRKADEYIKSRNFHVQIWRDERIGEVFKRSAFEYCTDIALKAKKNITVLSPHFTEWMETGNSHGEYLANGMSYVIEKHRKDPQADFTYLLFGFCNLRLGEPKGLMKKGSFIRVI
jgi:hypothetical protein